MVLLYSGKKAKKGWNCLSYFFKVKKDMPNGNLYPTSFVIWIPGF